MKNLSKDEMKKVMVAGLMNSPWLVAQLAKLLIAMELTKIAKTSNGVIVMGVQTVMNIV